MSTVTIMLIVLACIVIAILAVYAGYLLSKVNNQRKQIAMAAAKKRELVTKQYIKNLNSVILIAKAMQQKQCEISEGCWRLSVLINGIEEHSITFHTKFPAIFKLYDKIKHMPILEDRKSLSKKEKLTLDMERMGYELELEGAVQNDIDNLLPYSQLLHEELTQQ